MKPLATVVYENFDSFLRQLAENAQGLSLKKEVRVYPEQTPSAFPELQTLMIHILEELRLLNGAIDSQTHVLQDKERVTPKIQQTKEYLRKSAKVFTTQIVKLTPKQIHGLELRLKILNKLQAGWWTCGLAHCVNCPYEETQGYPQKQRKTCYSAAKKGWKLLMPVTLKKSKT